jgi:Glycosyltransferase 61
LVQRVVRYLNKAIKFLGLEKFILNTPRGFISTTEWIAANGYKLGAEFILLGDGKSIVEKPPVVVDYPVSKRFSKYYNRKSRDNFVSVIPRGRVFGEFSNIILTPDNLMLSDVSREFGAEGGRRPENFSIFQDYLRLPAPKLIKGKVAVISTCGSDNFHHWNFDTLPRLNLLKKAGLFDEIDYYIINYRGLKFQVEGLKKLDIDPGKIINPMGDPKYYVEAEKLFVPSLTEDLGTISPWVIEFLRSTFLPNPPNRSAGEKLYISRRTATSRKIINEPDVMNEIFGRGYVELIPEDYTMEETASIFANARSIVSVHGSGISNLPFISEGTQVLDIMAPWHQDTYYWMICNQRNSNYVAIFSEGEHPADNVDLVKQKKDDDLFIDLNKLKKALDLVA